MNHQAEYLEEELRKARAEIEEMRKRLAVPEGYVVVPEKKKTGAWESARIGDFNSGWNACRDSVVPLLERAAWMELDTTKRSLAIQDEMRAMLAAAPAPVERNQCDGCQAGIPVEGGMHRMGKPGGYADLMACAAERYGSAPVERVERVEQEAEQSPAQGNGGEIVWTFGSPQPVTELRFPASLCFLLDGSDDQVKIKFVESSGELLCSMENLPGASSGDLYSVFSGDGAIIPAFDTERPRRVYTTPQPAPTAAQDVAGLVEALKGYDQPVRVAIKMLERTLSPTAMDIALELKAALGDSCDALEAAHQSGGAKRC